MRGVLLWEVGAVDVQGVVYYLAGSCRGLGLRGMGEREGVG